MYKGKTTAVVSGGYNEEGKIGSVIRRIPHFVDHVIAVDDASTDSTGREARHAGAQLITNDRRMGPGAVLKTAFRRALDADADFIVVIAGDNQDDPAEIGKLLDQLLRGFDICLGSRYLAPHKAPFPRSAYLALYNWFFRAVTGASLTDASNGFRAYRSGVLASLLQDVTDHDSYDLEPMLLLKALRNRCAICEVPVHKTYRGKYSKMKPLIDWYRISRPVFSEVFR
ncbi:MAG: glycosyltransferase family 2 protein [archaeon]